MLHFSLIAFLPVTRLGSFPKPYDDRFSIELVVHPLDAPPSAPSSAQICDTSSALEAISNSATPRAHSLLPPSRQMTAPQQVRLTP